VIDLPGMGRFERVRILFTFVGGRGHFEPILPIAKATLAAGHTVAVVAGADMAETVAAEGFSVFPMGERRSAAPGRLPLQAHMKDLPRRTSRS
jgi:UDP:flavonoid glycosyltransferase YjiC (YdhE family)